MAKPLRHPQHPHLIDWGALPLAFWLLAIAIVPAARFAHTACANNLSSEVSPPAPAPKTGGYLPAVGAAPLRFDSPAPGGRPAGLQLPSLRSDRGTNATTPIINAPVSSAAGTTNEAVLPAAVAVPLPSLIAPADTNNLSLPPLNEPMPAAITLTDLQSVLKWLLPASANVPQGSVTFPVFAPATPPQSSKATYQNR